VRPLHGDGAGPVVGDRVVLAGEAERLAAEQPLEHGHRLGQARLPDGRRVERQTDGAVLRLVPTGADRDVQPAAGEHVEARELLGDDRRVAQVVVEHERRDPQGRGRRGHRRHGRDRREVVDQMVREHQRGVAGLLGPPGPVAQLGSGDDGARDRQEPERAHAGQYRGGAKLGPFGHNKNLTLSLD